MSDFTAFREFLLHFQVFTRNVKVDEDKLYFLKTCVKSSAQVKLKHLDLIPSNYKVALDILKRDYLDTEKLKEDFFLLYRQI